jgi:predicted dehydrogenase
VVSTPTHHHEEITVAALDAGKHVLCEKPLSNDVESCRRIVAAARRSGRVLGVGFNHRYFPPFRRLKRLIDAGELGRLDHLRLFGGHDGIRNFHGDWMYRSPLSGGGAMMDIGIHLTDLCAFLAGDVVGVRAVLGERTWRIEGSEDNALAILETAAGVPAIYQATWSEWRGYRFSVEAYGDLGMARASIAPMTSVVVKRSGARRYALYPWLNLREKVAGWQALARDSFAAEIRDFIGAIHGQGSAFADGDAGLRAVEVAAAARESSRSGDTVRLRPGRAGALGGPRARSVV